MLTKENLLKVRLGAKNEGVIKQGDVYKVKPICEVPKSLINAFVSKAKKEHDIDPRETWSDMDMAELFVNYIASTYLNIDSIPVDAIMGSKDIEVKAEVTPADVTASVTPITPTPEGTPVAEVTPPVESTPPVAGPEGVVEV